MGIELKWSTVAERSGVSLEELKGTESSPHEAEEARRGIQLGPPQGKLFRSTDRPTSL